MYCVWDLKRVGTFPLAKKKNKNSKMNGCHTKFLPSSDIYKS